MDQKKHTTHDIVEVVTTCDHLDIGQSDIESCIVSVRGVQVMLDSNLAMLYGVETKVLNQAVKRNIKRFPTDFMFQLTKDEASTCSRSQFVTLNTGRGHNIKYLPYAFTENGIAMLSSVLRSQKAIDVNILIMRAFTAMRKFLYNNVQVFQRLETIEHHQLALGVEIKQYGTDVKKYGAEVRQYKEETDRRIEEVFRRLDEGAGRPKQGIFFDGQVYDAYGFVSNLIKQAKSDIVLIDNYVDETVLTLLDKRNSDVAATIYTAKVDKQLQLDIVKHNSQYPAIDVKVYTRSHDRFLCIDDAVYHIGASIKDLGKKWFAFSILEDTQPIDLVNKINGVV